MRDELQRLQDNIKQLEENISKMRFIMREICYILKVDRSEDEQQEIRETYDSQDAIRQTDRNKQEWK